MKKMMKKFMKDERGLELSEYAVMLALIVIGVIVAIGALSGAIDSKFSETADEINGTP